MAVRVQHQQAYILHTRPYSESSWLIDGFSKDYGRVSLLAKGARRLKSKVRGLIRPFQPLLLSWSGKGELQTLTAVESVGISTSISQQSWLCANYMNELLIKLLHRHDPHEQLFDQYQQSLESLHEGYGQQMILRIFEKQLLSEIGYGLQLEQDVNNQAIEPDQTYSYYPDRGPVLSNGQQLESTWQVSGATLIALATEKFQSKNEIEQSKRLMRILLNQSLQGRELKSRKVLRSVNALQ